MTENKRFENRLNKDNIKFNTLNPVWDNEKEDCLNVFEMIEELNALNEENQVLKVTNMEMEDCLARIKLENLKLKNRCKNIRIYVDDLLYDLNRGFLGISRDDLKAVMEKIRWYSEGEDK